MVWMLFFQLTPFPSLHHKRLLSVFYSEFHIHGILKFNVKICDAQVKLNLYRRWLWRWHGIWHRTWHRTWYGIWHGRWHRRWHFQNFQLSLILNMKNLQRSNTNMFWLHWHHDYRWTSAKHHFLPHYIMHTFICLLQKWWHSSCSILRSVILLLRFLFSSVIPNYWCLLTGFVRKLHLHCKIECLFKKTYFTTTIWNTWEIFESGVMDRLGKIKRLHLGKIKGPFSVCNIELCWFSNDKRTIYVENELKYGRGTMNLFHAIILFHTKSHAKNAHCKCTL